MFCLILSPVILVAQSEWKEIPTPKEQFIQSFHDNRDYMSDGFDFPVGRPNASHYYKARKYREFNHLGEDWNAVTGGNTDLGDPIYVIGNGLVTYAEDVDQGARGWGKVIRIVHCMKKGNKYQLVESLYAHLDEIYVSKGQWLKRGDLIGTIGTANGQYLAHLHLEIRSDVLMLLGAAYGDDSKGYLYPTEFIQNNRPIGSE